MEEAHYRIYSTARNHVFIFKIDNSLRDLDSISYGIGGIGKTIGIGDGYKSINDFIEFLNGKDNVDNISIKNRLAADAVFVCNYDIYCIIGDGVK